jgi:hypothetical protein
MALRRLPALGLIGTGEPAGAGRPRAGTGAWLTGRYDGREGGSHAAGPAFWPAPGTPRGRGWQAGSVGLFTLAEARAELARLRPVLDRIVAVRADAAELAAALQVGGPPTRLGGVPEWKAAQAQLDELMTAVQRTGAELGGLAPLLVDFPADLDGETVLLCWLEGEPELTWYHRPDLGFAGRRPLPDGRPSRTDHPGSR